QPPRRGHTTTPAGARSSFTPQRGHATTPAGAHNHPGGGTQPHTHPGGHATTPAGAHNHPGGGTQLLHPPAGARSSFTPQRGHAAPPPLSTPAHPSIVTRVNPRYCILAWHHAMGIS
ncbi:MAG: hypothetical protein K0U36_07135, partial [Alphaproteobacteria bacterium]|nr:hypothetical protein [Alphaproteobacteria bacterium]